MAGAALSTQLAFDYGDMPASDSKAMERHAEVVLRIQERQRKATAENVLKLGGELRAAQQRLSNHGNGTFGKWCKERVGLTPQGALQYIRIWESVGDKRFETYVSNFDFTSLRELTKDTCPEEALADALKLAKKGEVITHKRAKDIIASHTVGDPEESDDEPDEGDEAQETDAFEWQPADFVTATRRHVRQWIQRCPAEELHYIYETLRDLAAQIERKQDGGGDA